MARQAVPASEDYPHLASGPQEVLSVVDCETNMVQSFTFLGEEVRDRSWAQWLDNLKAGVPGLCHGILGRQPQQAYAHIFDDFVMDALQPQNLFEPLRRFVRIVGRYGDTSQ